MVWYLVKLKDNFTFTQYYNTKMKLQHKWQQQEMLSEW
jgi:hypothetical protein